MLAPPPPFNRLRILFVDDEAMLREFMRTELPRLGHQVTVCADSKSGIETVKKATFDAAILDMRMEHDKAGLQVLAALKQASPNTEAVIMTGYGSQDTAVEALRLGAFDYLTKPCKLSDIEALLGRIQEKHRLKIKKMPEIALPFEYRFELAFGKLSHLLNGRDRAMTLRALDTLRRLLAGQSFTAMADDDRDHSAPAKRVKSLSKKLGIPLTRHVLGRQSQPTDAAHLLGKWIDDHLDELFGRNSN